MSIYYKDEIIVFGSELSLVASDTFERTWHCCHNDQCLLIVYLPGPSLLFPLISVILKQIAPQLILCPIACGSNRYCDKHTSWSRAWHEQTIDSLAWSNSSSFSMGRRICLGTSFRNKSKFRRTTWSIRGESTLLFALWVRSGGLHVEGFRFRNIGKLTELVLNT